MESVRPAVVLRLSIAACLILVVGNCNAQDFDAFNNVLRRVNSNPQPLHSNGNGHLEIDTISESLFVMNISAFWSPKNLFSLRAQVPASIGTNLLGGPYGNLSAECTKGIDKLLNTTDPSTGIPLIYMMIDAIGKIGPGYEQGNTYASGAYDECFNIGPGYTQYCTGYVLLYKGVPTPMTWVFGMCVPQGCTTYDIMVSVLTATNGYAISDPNPANSNCVSTRTPPYNAGAIVMITVCCLFAALVMAGTAFDFVTQRLQNVTYNTKQLPVNADVSSFKSENTPLLQTSSSAVKKSFNRIKVINFIAAFSILKIVPQILSTKQPPSAITSINGLRVMSMFWVILCHTHYWTLLTGVENPLLIKSVASRFTFQAIGNAFFSVDSFFFLSGLLVAYLTMRQMKRKNGRFPFLTYYLHRYLRLTPTYAFVLFFIWFLMMHLADGPTYNIAAGIESASYQNCKKYWWTNLLYINNLYPWKMEEECIGWTWYLANDMQFYIFSPLILIPLYFLFPVGLIVSAVVLIVSFVISGTLAAVYNLQANEFAAIAYNYTSNTSATTNFQNLLYIKPWHRVSPYIVGLLLGYVLYRLRLPNTKRYVYIKYIVFSIMWVLSGVFLVSTLYGLYFQWHGHVPSKFENVLYITFARFTWSLGLALLVFICHYGYGGPVNWFLSLKFWIPLSRISYNAYLIHPLMLTVIFGSERKLIYYQDYTLTVYALGIIVLSFGAAAIVSVFVEFPIGNLEEALFKLVGLGRHESARTGGDKDETNRGNVSIAKHEDTIDTHKTKLLSDNTNLPE